MPLPTGGCASAACLMVHTISSISALSCLSDNTVETGRESEKSNTWRQEVSAKLRNRDEDQRRDKVSWIQILLHHLSSCCFFQLWCEEARRHCTDFQRKTTDLTLFSLNGFLQQKFCHTLPVLQQLLRTFPQRVDQVSSVLVELKHNKIFYEECWIIICLINLKQLKQTCA